jgi:hypothetical protein
LVDFMTTGDITNAGSSSTSRVRQYSQIFFGIVVLLAAVVAIGNYAMRPLSYSRSALKEVATDFVSGRNYAILDPNIDWRNLRREVILQMKVAPDFIVYGGSRWQEASSNLTPGHSFYSAFIHNDYYEDLVAIAEILRDADRLPKTLVLSIRFATFQPRELRSVTLWKDLMDGYQKAADRLGLVQRSKISSIHYEKWLGLFSINALFDNIKLHWNAEERAGPVNTLLDPNRDIIAADGSLHFSQKHLDGYTVEFAKKDAVMNAEREKNRRLLIEPEAVESFEKVIKSLQADGVRIVFLQTPFHPLYYKNIQGFPRFADLQAVKAQAIELGKKLNVPVGGSFDPEELGCGENEFRDYHHSTESCLVKVFATVQDLLKTDN